MVWYPTRISFEPLAAIKRSRALTPSNHKSQPFQSRLLCRNAVCSSFSGGSNIAYFVRTSSAQVPAEVPILPTSPKRCPLELQLRSRSRDRGADRGRWQLVLWPSVGEAFGVVAKLWGGCWRHVRAMGRAIMMDAGEQPIRQERDVLLLVRSMARFHEMARDLLEDIHDDCG